MSRLGLLAALAAGLVLGAGVASACPAAMPQAGAAHLSARDLATPRTAPVRAGGTVVLEACAERPGTGYVPFAPQAIVHYHADLRGRGLEISARGTCAPVLLVLTARGNWYFDDGAGRAAGPRLILANPRPGRYHIWVGSRDAFGCDADLVLRTVRATRAGLQRRLH